MRRHRYLPVLLSLLIILAITAACSDESTNATEAPTVSATSTQQATEEETPSPTPETTTESSTTEETSDVEPDPVAAEEAELIWTFVYENEDFAPQSLAMHPDGEVVTVGAYMATYTHRLYDSELTDVDTDYTHSVDSLSYLSDGHYLAAGLAVGGTWVKELTDETEPVQLHRGNNSFVAADPNRSILATGNRDGVIWLWSMPDESLAELSDGGDDYLWGLTVHPSGEQVASLQWTDEGLINIWSIPDQMIIKTMEPDILVGSSNNVISYSRDGAYFAAYFREDWDHSIRIFDTDQYNLIAEIPLEKAANQIAFSHDGQMISVASLYEQTKIWSSTTGELIYTLDQTLDETNTTGGSKALAFTPDDGHLAVIRNYGDLELWRLPGAEPLPEPTIDIYQPVPIPGDVLFDRGSYDLKNEADDVLKQLAEDIYATAPKAKLTFFGHTDSRGDASANLQLSNDRAQSVSDWFTDWTEENNADGWTFAIEGKGETELKAPDVDSEGNFREEAGIVNRRVEIRIEPVD
ncbi:MAG: OmpA family protein [Eubacteriales bacterium]|nr:OmpA family protein [Eubacteriales bacterium]